jgi:hypothetical protein
LRHLAGWMRGARSDARRLPVGLHRRRAASPAFGMGERYSADLLADTQRARLHLSGSDRAEWRPRDSRRGSFGHRATAASATRWPGAIEILSLRSARARPARTGGVSASGGRPVGAAGPPIRIAGPDTGFAACKRRPWFGGMFDATDQRSSPDDRSGLVTPPAGRGGMSRQHLQRGVSSSSASGDVGRTRVLWDESGVE